MQQELATEINRRRKEAQQLHAEAEQEWAAAKARFESALLGEGV